MKEKWIVTYTWHTHEEEWLIGTKVVEGENISEAMYAVGDELNEKMEQNNWSDYWITGINVIPELH